MLRIASGVVLILAVAATAGCETVHGRQQVNVNWQCNQEQVKSLGVLEFDWAAPEYKMPEGLAHGHLTDAGPAISDIVASELMKLSRYKIRERTDLKRVLEEHAFQLSDLVSKGDYRTIGKIAEVDAVVVGRVSMANVVAGVGFMHVGIAYSCRCVSTTTGDVLWSIGGDKDVGWTQQLMDYWFRTLTDELVKDLKDKLDHPPSARQGSQ